MRDLKYLTCWLIYLSVRLNAFIKVFPDIIKFKENLGFLSQKNEISREKWRKINMANFHDFGRNREKNSNLGTHWRIFNVEVPLNQDPGKDVFAVHESLLSSVIFKLGLNVTTADLLRSSNVSVVRKSFDVRARVIKIFGQPVFSYTVDIVLNKFLASQVKLQPADGKFELLNTSNQNTNLAETKFNASGHSKITSNLDIIVVGSGPAGLFAALALAEAGLRPVIIERGQPVESRGRDIGALFHRSVLNEDSNLWYVTSHASVVDFIGSTLCIRTVATERGGPVRGVMGSSPLALVRTAILFEECWKPLSGKV